MHAAREPRSHYLLIGLAVAGLWLLNRDKSLLYHAVQMTAIMTALTLLQLVLRSRGAVRPASLGVYAGLFSRLLGAKLVLVGLGVGAEWLLSQMTSRSNGIVAALLVVLVTALGPLVDRHATGKAMAAAGPEKGLIHD